MPRFIYFLYLIPLGMGAMISLRTFRLAWPRPYRMFSLFLAGTFIMELLAISWKLWLHQSVFWNYSKSNVWIYNIYYIPEYLFYFLFYYNVLGKKAINFKVFLFICSFYLLGSISNIFFIQGIFQLDTYTIMAGNVGVLLFSLLYFKHELQRATTSNVLKDSLFWISTGAFIFHTVSLPYFIFINYLSRANLNLAIVLFNILFVLNIIMHSMYLIAFLCSKPFQKKSI